MGKATLLMVMVWMLIQQLHLILIWRRTVEQQRKLDLLSREMLEVRNGMARQKDKEAAPPPCPQWTLPARDTKGRFLKRRRD